MAVPQHQAGAGGDGVTVYTLFGQVGGSTLVADANPYTMGVQFSVTEAGCTLTAMWWFSPSGAGILPGTIALFAVSGASLVHSESASWSGAAGSGWVRAPFASPPSLTPSTAYIGAILQPADTNFYSATAHYWDTGAGSGGITKGPLSAPNNAGAANGQDVFNSGGVLTFPATSFNATNYWADPEITAPTPVAAAQQVTGGGRSMMKTSLLWADL